MQIFHRTACAGGGELTIYHDVIAEDLNCMLAELEEDGWNLFDDHREGENDFAVLNGKAGVITLSYLPHKNEIRRVDQPGEQLPVDRPGDFLCAPLLTQVKLCYFTDDCGMTYVIRLRDGRFLLIDGGVGKYDEARQLMDILRAQNVLPDIRIAAWFITHPHGDHFGGFTALMEQFGEEITLENLLFNWPNPDMTGPFSPLDQFNAVIKRYAPAVYTPHAGQRFRWSGTDVDVLFACEDLYPNRIDNLNDSSLVIRLIMEGRRILFPGDGSALCSAELCARYPAESLKSEFLQVPHHGYWGGSAELFRRIDPEVLLWPCPDFWYQVIRGWECNRFLVESPNIRETFVAGQQQITLDMTQPVPAAEPYPPRGKVLMQENFSAQSLVGLNWTCVTGGSTGYRPLGVEFPAPGVCRLAAGEARSVCELLQPGQLAGADRITLSLRGRVIGSSPTLLGLWYNHPSPTVWSDEAILPLECAADGSLSLELTLDSPFCGLYLLMQAGEIELTRVSVSLG